MSNPNALFFEGFNNLNSYNIKIDENYWSTNDITKLSHVEGRTGNQIKIANRPIASGLEFNNTLTLSNFTDPLDNHNAFGFGFYTDPFSIRTNNNNAPAPYAENFISFYNGSTEVLRIDIIKTTFESTNSAGFGIYQNNNLVDTYDFKSFSGYSWGVYSEANTISIQDSAYIEIYIEPKNNNKIALRISSRNTIEGLLRNSSNSIYTTITGFNNLTSIKFYSTNDAINWNRTIDDLYLIGGNNINDCLLGHETRIYRLNPSSDSSYQDWDGLENGTVNPPYFYYVSSDDGDATLIYSSVSGDQSIYNLQNIPEPSPTYVSGVKLINIPRKYSTGKDANIINVCTSGNDSVPVDFGNPYLINSDTYSSKTQFVFINPITGNMWTKQEINDMQFGIKHIGTT